MKMKRMTFTFRTTDEARFNPFIDRLSKEFVGKDIPDSKLRMTAWAIGDEKTRFDLVHTESQLYPDHPLAEFIERVFQGKDFPEIGDF